MWDLSRICGLYHSLRQRQIPKPLSEAKDWICILTRYVGFLTMGTLIFFFLNGCWWHWESRVPGTSLGGLLEWKIWDDLLRATRVFWLPPNFSSRMTLFFQLSENSVLMGTRDLTWFDNFFVILFAILSGLGTFSKKLKHSFCKVH